MDVPVVLLLLCMAASGPAATYSHSHHRHDHHPYLYSHTRHHHEGSDGFTSLPERMVEEGELVASSMDTHHKKDLDALLSFKQSVTADPYGILSNWTAENSGTICSSWYGISCRLHSKRVVAIHLVEKDLEGRIPPDFGKMKVLQTLNLSSNWLLSGPIPAELGLLKALRTLDLSQNQLSNSIPAELGQLKALRTLDLSGNQLSSSIPVELCQLQNLQSLALDDNDFSGRMPRQLGEIPASIGSMNHLRLLNLSWNQLQGSIPANLSKISTLEQLDFSHNNLSGPIPQDLSELHELAVLDVSSNKLCGKIPTGTQFSTFSVTSFQNNTCLWGCPLDSCNENERHERKGDNAINNSSVTVGWLSQLNENISLIALAIGMGIGFGGVVSIFVLCKRANHWIMSPNMPRPFFGVYRFPT